MSNVELFNSAYPRIVVAILNQSMKDLVSTDYDTRCDAIKFFASDEFHTFSMTIGAGGDELPRCISWDSHCFDYEWEQRYAILCDKCNTKCVVRESIIDEFVCPCTVNV